MNDPSGRAVRRQSAGTVERPDRPLVFVADCLQLVMQRAHLERCGYRLTAALSSECRALVFCCDHLSDYESAAAGIDAPKIVVGANPPASWRQAERLNRPLLPIDLERRIAQLLRGADAPAGAELRLLIVEDDATVRAAAEAAFEEAGFDVRSVAGFGLVQSEMNLCPDVILMDLNLPGLSGEQLGEILRCQGVPIVIFSSAPPERLEAARVDIGAVGAFSKGVPLPQIAAWIREYLLERKA